ncbi:hypothetical protein CCACVL1_03692 [Corchorus capsularis]|uniref:Uncharacterized protein n=1 Tax=Corchorus capsularis TaxID=210143 RepID=A0A1R3JXV8_COCAP|nr:hypothetical protein CCACVL1_03692 [Corchorus capsularis]
MDIRPVIQRFSGRKSGWVYNKNQLPLFFLQEE